MAIALPLAAAFSLSFLFTPAMLRVATKFSLLDYADNRKVHIGAKPYLGASLFSSLVPCAP